MQIHPLIQIHPLVLNYEHLSPAIKDCILLTYLTLTTLNKKLQGH